MEACHDGWTPTSRKSALDAADFPQDSQVQTNSSAGCLTGNGPGAAAESESGAVLFMVDTRRGADNFLFVCRGYVKGTPVDRTIGTPNVSAI